MLYLMGRPRSAKKLLHDQGSEGSPATSEVRVAWLRRPRKKTAARRKAKRSDQQASRPQSLVIDQYAPRGVLQSAPKKRVKKMRRNPDRVLYFGGLHTYLSEEDAEEPRSRISFAGSNTCTDGAYALFTRPVCFPTDVMTDPHDFVVEMARQLKLCDSDYEFKSGPYDNFFHGDLTGIPDFEEWG
ncbi:hypothetical protein ACLOJK_028210 [Asimina triloba]